MNISLDKNFARGSNPTCLAVTGKVFLESTFHYFDISCNIVQVKV